MAPAGLHSHQVVRGLKFAQNGWVAAGGDGSRLLTACWALLATETGWVPSQPPAPRPLPPTPPHPARSLIDVLVQAGSGGADARLGSALG